MVEPLALKDHTGESRIYFERAVWGFGILVCLTLVLCARIFYACMSSKGFGQIRYRNKRGFQVPDTSFCSIKQPLKSNCTSHVESSFSS